MKRILLFGVCCSLLRAEEKPDYLKTYAKFQKLVQQSRERDPQPVTEYDSVLQNLKSRLAKLRKKSPLLRLEENEEPRAELSLKVSSDSKSQSKTGSQLRLRAQFDRPSRELFSHLSGRIPATLNELVQAAVRRNAGALFKNLQRQSDQFQIESERGILDARFSFSARRRIVDQPNDAQESLTRRGQAQFESSAGEYEMGFGGTFRSGAEWGVRLIYDKLNSSIINQFNNYAYEYTDNVDVSLRVPLKRGAGENATLIKVDLAKVNKDMSVSRYRQELMNVVGLAIQNYWRLYGAVELEKSWKESLDLARQQYQDARLKVQSGRAPQTELLQIESAIALRQIELASVRSTITRLQVQLLNLLSLQAQEEHRAWFAPVDEPKASNIEAPALNESFELARENWPEFEMARQKVRLEEIKARHARNEMQPRLDIVGNARNTNLKDTSKKAFGSLFSDEHVSWYAGVEYSMPFENTMAEGKLKVAELKLRQARLELDSLNRTLKNGLYDRIEQLKALSEQLYYYRVAMDKEQELLEVAEEQVDFGRAGIQAVFEQQEKLISYKRRMLNTIVELKLTEAALQKALGTLLGRFEVQLEDVGQIHQLPEPVVQGVRP